METLDTTHPDYLTYRYEQFTFTLLGGVKQDTPSRMQATVKVEHRETTLRHSLDLYNDNQLEKLIKKTAEKTGIGITYIGKAFDSLVSELERYRFEETQKKQEKEQTKPTLTPEQLKEAVQYLKAENLLERTNEDIGRSGVTGEETNRLLMYLVFSYRKQNNPLHVMSLAASGTGKSHLQEKVSELIPDEDKIEITTLSDNAFYYFGQQELKHKLVLIEDLDGAGGALYPLREIMSKKTIRKTVAHKDAKGNTKTIHLTVEGPICVAGCTTQESIYEDNANRSFLLYLDESKEQDARIMAHQRKHAAGKTDSTQENKTKQQHHNIQRALKPVRIINPFAEHLQIPTEVLKPRRTNAHYLAFVEAVTYYHQYQRTEKADKETGEVYIETTLEDIENANRLIKEVLLRKSDDLNNACRRYFEYLKAYLKSEKKESFGLKEVRHALRVNHSNQKRWMLMLLENSLVRKSPDFLTRNNQYEVISYEEYEQLKGRINNVLDEILTHLKLECNGNPAKAGGTKKILTESTTLNSSATVHGKNEPPNKKITSK